VPGRPGGRGRRYDERGIAVSSPVAVLSLAAVVLAGVAFVSTSGGSPEQPADTVRPVTAAPSPAATRTARRPVITKEKAKPKRRTTATRRGEVFVEVYNNSGISGLAGATADTIAGAGWQVVGSDNWYGTIPASTVYYPDRLRAEARLLARDLGISRLKPAIAPMRLDRLTVILTTDYSS
jgi:hypothetical protein